MLDLFRTLPGIVKDIEASELVREAVVFAAWRKIAGESLGDHAVALSFENSKLSIAVSNLTWQRHLKDLRSQMVFKINAALGAAVVSSIELCIDESAVLRERAKLAANSKPIAELEAEKEISPELTDAAARIEDDELRKQFLLAAGNCLVRKRRTLER